MPEFSRSTKVIALSIAGAIVLLSGTGYYIHQRAINSLRIQLAETNKKIDEQKLANGETVKELTDIISHLENSSSTLADSIRTQEEKSNIISQQIGTVTSNVDELEKLSRMDPELLKKYSKVYFLNEHYVPLSLTRIDPRFAYDPKRMFDIHSSVWPHLLALLSAANNDGVKPMIDSAYRSFGTQAVLKSSYRFTYGAGTANSFSAEQGYSEHQLGTTVDFTSPAINGALAGFDKTKEYVWLLGNAYKYGFILSYPKDNAYYTYEPWHWRYVGVKLATDLHAKGKYFYDTDQREIDAYLIDLFD